jgi:predicted protein tyrosine phosphatase
MITKVFALSLAAFKQKISENPNLGKDNCIISIAGNGAAPFFPNDTESILTLNFDDTMTDDHDVDNHGLFTAAQARRIIAFVRKNNARSGPVNLYIHCAAGISRSGAVALFANELLALNMTGFRANNPAIQPNLFVYDILCSQLSSQHAD